MAKTSCGSLGGLNGAGPLGCLTLLATFGTSPPVLIAPLNLAFFLSSLNLGVFDGGGGGGAGGSSKPPPSPKTSSSSPGFPTPKKEPSSDDSFSLNCSSVKANSLIFFLITLGTFFAFNDADDDTIFFDLSSFRLLFSCLVGDPKYISLNLFISVCLSFFSIVLFLISRFIFCSYSNLLLLRIC